MARTYRVLPTDPRFRDLTEEQAEWLWRSEKQALEDASNAREGAQTYSDPDFSEWEKELDAAEGAADLAADDQWDEELTLE